MIKFVFERDENSIYMGDYVSGVNNVSMEYDTDASRSELVEGFNALLKVMGYDPVVEDSERESFDDVLTDAFPDWPEIDAGSDAILRDWQEAESSKETNFSDYSTYTMSYNGNVDTLTTVTLDDPELTYGEYVDTKSNGTTVIVDTDDLNMMGMYELGDVSVNLNVDEEEK